MSGCLVTILIPHYKTLELTRLCLEVLRKHTDLETARVIVIDNGSQDASTEYLRAIDWVTFMERAPVSGEPPYISHSNALDMALETVDTPYVLSIHTDTFVKRPDWLSFLLQHIEDKPKVAGVGSWKLEAKAWYRRVLKKIERFLQLFWCRITGKKPRAIAGVGEHYYYLRSHCALYRTDLLRKFGLHFNMEDAPAGKIIHKRLCDHGYEMVMLPSEQLLKYMEHVNHATTALNPQLGSRKKSITKGQRRLRKKLKQWGAKV